jgi:hypothetical protein
MTAESLSIEKRHDRKVLVTYRDAVSYCSMKIVHAGTRAAVEYRLTSQDY